MVDITNFDWLNTSQSADFLTSLRYPHMPSILKENWMALVLASALGLVGGGVSLQVIDVRPHPHTSLDDQQARKEDRDWVKEYIKYHSRISESHVTRQGQLDGKIDTLTEKVLVNTILLQEHIKATALGSFRHQFRLQTEEMKPAILFDNPVIRMLQDIQNDTEVLIEIPLEITEDARAEG